MNAQCEVCDSPTATYRLGASRLNRCAQCGHLRRNLTDAPAYARDHAYGGEPSLDAVRLTLTYRTLRREFADVPAAVFEIGYGTGALLRRFHADGAHIAGADPDQLQQDVDADVRAHGQLFTSGIEDAPIQPASVDGVYGVHVLEHVDNPLETLRRSRELLRPGGIAQFLTPAADWAPLRWCRDGWWMLEDPTHVRFFTTASLARLATAAGFDEVVVKRPVLDSLVTDAASAIRRFHPAPRPAGVLVERWTMPVAAATAPAVLTGRLLCRTNRPTLHLIAKVAA